MPVRNDKGDKWLVTLLLSPEGAEAKKILAETRATCLAVGKTHIAEMPDDKLTRFLIAGLQSMPKPDLT